MWSKQHDIASYNKLHAKEWLTTWKAGRRYACSDSVVPGDMCTIIVYSLKHGTFVYDTKTEVLLLYIDQRSVNMNVCLCSQLLFNQNEKGLYLHG